MKNTSHGSILLVFPFFLVPRGLSILTFQEAFFWIGTRFYLTQRNRRVEGILSRIISMFRRFFFVFWLLQDSNLWVLDFLKLNQNLLKLSNFIQNFRYGNGVLELNILQMGYLHYQIMYSPPYAPGYVS